MNVGVDELAAAAAAAVSVAIAAAVAGVSACAAVAAGVLVVCHALRMPLYVLVYPPTMPSPQLFMLLPHFPLPPNLF